MDELFFWWKGYNTIYKELADTQDMFISVYPNAGLPNVLGEYDELLI